MNLKDVTTSISLDTGAVLKEDNPTSKGDNPASKRNVGDNLDNDQRDTDSLSNGDLKQIVTLVSPKVGDTKL